MRQFSLPYGIISATCLLAHNAIMIGADAMGFSIWKGLAISFACIVVLGFGLHSRFTFRQPFNVKAFGRYAFAMAANIPLSYVTLWLCHVWLHIPMILASPLASGLMLLVNFFLAHWAILGPRTSPKQSPATQESAPLVSEPAK